ncbi:cache domain-containing sensor histidine kinase [Paenibacillus periandrae]|uniref:cache domain-containing sensor histidine kinase n=1 Tax=Paenibacillus periandrae TaxID=1761741 RepID=UPI001F089F82
METSRTIQADIEVSSDQILIQANLNLSRYYREYEQFFVLIAGSPEFRRWLQAQKGDQFDLLQNYQQISNRYIEPFITLHPEMLSITLYNSNGNQLIYRNYNHDFPMLLKKNYSLRDESWLASVTLSGKIEKIITQSDNYDDAMGKSLHVPIMTQIQKYQFNGNEGYLAIDISISPTQRILNEIRLGNNGVGLIVDDSGTIIAHPDSVQITNKLGTEISERLSQSPSGNFFIASTGEMAVFRTIPYSNWKLIVLVPYRDMAQAIDRIGNATVYIALIGLFFGICLTVIVSTSITRRLQTLRLMFKMTQIGRFDLRVKVEGNDEVADLAISYNQLLQQIETSIQDLASARILQMEAAFSAMQSQIHSHFLYNALESINAMANLVDHLEIRQTTVALSNMLRYTSNYSETVVNLKDECNHLRNYLHIIQIIYGDDIKFVIEHPEFLEQISCLKAIIQPIVENSIKHGYEVIGEPVMISVTAQIWKEAYIKIVITDNGAGFTPNKLEELQRLLSDSPSENQYKQLTSVGLLNVQYRLKMYYSDAETGVWVENRPGQSGVLVNIIFPYRQGSPKEVHRL